VEIELIASVFRTNKLLSMLKLLQVSLAVKCNGSFLR